MTEFFFKTNYLGLSDILKKCIDADPNKFYIKLIKVSDKLFYNFRLFPKVTNITAKKISQKDDFLDVIQETYMMFSRSLKSFVKVYQKEKNIENIEAFFIGYMSITIRFNSYRALNRTIKKNSKYITNYFKN